MECKQTQNLIEKLVSGTIADQELKDLHKHADTCATCSDILEKASFAAKAFDDVPEVDCPPRLTRSIMSSLKAQGAFKNKSSNIIKVNFYSTPVFRTAVSVAAVFILVFMLFTGKNSNNTNPGNTPGTQIASNEKGLDTPADNTKGDSGSAESITDYECKVLLAAPGCFFKTAANDWQPVKTGKLLQRGYSLKTGAGQLIIQYKDMTEVRIKPDSHVVIASNALKIQKGATWLKVTKKQSRFEITTPTCVAGVLGTRLGVCLNDKGVSCVSVFEGKVMVTAAENHVKKADKPVFLLANEKVFASFSKGLSRKCLTSDNEENVWMDKDMVLTTEYTMPSIRTKYCSVPEDETGETDSSGAVNDTPDVDITPVTDEPAIDDTEKTVIYGSVNAMDNDIEEE